MARRTFGRFQVAMARVFVMGWSATLHRDAPAWMRVGLYLMYLFYAFWLILRAALKSAQHVISSIMPVGLVRRRPHLSLHALLSQPYSAITGTYRTYRTSNLLSVC